MSFTSTSYNWYTVALTVYCDDNTIFVFEGEWTDDTAGSQSIPNSRPESGQFCLLTYPFIQKWVKKITVAAITAELGIAARPAFDVYSKAPSLLLNLYCTEYMSSYYNNIKCLVIRSELYALISHTNVSIRIFILLLGEIVQYITLLFIIIRYRSATTLYPFRIKY